MDLLEKESLISLGEVLIKQGKNHIEIDAYEIMSGKINAFYDDEEFTIVYDSQRLILEALDPYVLEQVEKIITSLLGQITIGYSFCDKLEKYPITYYCRLWWSEN